MGNKSAIDFDEVVELYECVDDFAVALKRKLSRKMVEGKRGWNDPAWPREDIIRQLREHLDKGDMIDVAAFAMFAWFQSERGDPPPSP